MGGKSQAPGVDQNEIIDRMTQANRIDQYTDDGSIVYSGPDNRVATVSLSPEQQAIKDAQRALTMEATQGMAGNMGGAVPGLGEGMFRGAQDEMSALASQIGGLGNLDLSALSAMPQMGDFAGERDQVQGATMDRLMGLINPQHDRREGREVQSLTNRGVPEIGGLADAMSGRRADDYQQATMGAALQSILAGGQEQSRLFGQGMAKRGQGLQEQLANIGNMSKNRQQLFGEILQSFGAGSSMDNESFNKLAAMLGMSQVNSPGAGMAGWQPAGMADVGGAYNTAQNAWQMNQENSAMNQALGLAGTLGGAALGASTFMSSIDVKESFCPVDPAKILEKLDGLEVPSWKYRGEKERHIGPVAEEFAAAFDLEMPQVDGINGISTVDAFGIALNAIKALSARVRELEARG